LVVAGLLTAEEALLEAGGGALVGGDLGRGEEALPHAGALEGGAEQGRGLAGEVVGPGLEGDGEAVAVGGGVEVEEVGLVDHAMEGVLLRVGGGEATGVGERGAAGDGAVGVDVEGEGLGEAGVGGVAVVGPAAGLALDEVVDAGQG
jgi:hypothetical protein